MQRRNQNIGNLHKIDIEDNAIRFEAENGVQIVSSPLEKVLRIQAKHNSDNLESLPSYAVVGEFENRELDIKEEESGVEVCFDGFMASFSAHGLLCTINDSNWNTIVEDNTHSISWLRGEVTCYKKIQEGERYIGLGEKTGPLDRRGQAFVHWNTDKFAYGIDDDPIYASIPFYIGTHRNGCYGIFLDNTSRSTFNFGASNNRFMYFSAENGDLDYYFIGGDTPREILNTYNQLTGTMQLPPVWSLGLQQCRYSYYPDSEVVNLAQNFRNRKIPADLIYLDIHYMDKYRVFTFDEDRFPDPKRLVDQLQGENFELAVIVDPGVKREKGYETYEDGKINDAFVRYPDRKRYTANVWPGESAFPDFTKPSAREWWGSKFNFYTEKGIKGYWNDMNEPASWGQHTPDLIDFNFEGHLTSHKDARNVYGMQMARATKEGVESHMGNERAFVLTRAAYSGIQRYAALWTGDNVANDDHMLLGVRLLNSISASGVPFCGYDVGGFAGESTPELFARWIALGAFSPMFRCHSMINTRDAEPWSFGEQVEIISRNYIELRYRLLPLIYSQFYQASINGNPIQNNLTLDYPTDPVLYEEEFQNQYMFCDRLLIVPTRSDEKIKKFYLPMDGWYHLFTDKKLNKGTHYMDTPIDKIPILVKEGSIIPIQSVTQSTKELPTDVLELHVYKGRKYQTLEYYEDDGTSNDYQNGKYYKRSITMNNKHLLFRKVEGEMNSKFTKVKIFFHGFERLKVIDSTEHYAFFDKMPAFDPFYKPEEPEEISNLQSLTLPFTKKEIKVNIG